MEKHRAIPEGYMTVGEAAKKMGVTVRTLQYYDREHLLCPSAASEGGRRLYSDKDLIKLHQILSLKSLGFSLDDIRERLIPLDSPADVAKALSEQAAGIQQKITSLSESLKEIEALKNEVLQMQQVDFKKYADIIVNLQMKNEFYFLIKHFDDKMLDHIHNQFDKDSALAFIKRFSLVMDAFAKLQEQNLPSDSEESLLLAKDFWDIVTEFTGGDMSLLSQLLEIAKPEGANEDWEEKLTLIQSYIQPALEAYFKRAGTNPFA
ncbi:MAG: MerR family transcriptional regulator [Lachnospiraceae bacterium]|nr:MerR family transcriptional regulator [Lachnospiraceae bacterium]